MDKKRRLFTISAIVIVLIALSVAVFAVSKPKQCNNGIDDDNDGLIDYPQDPGCSSNGDNTETSPNLVCDNGIDESNDADILADYRLINGDPGCSSPTDTSEIDGQCDDLIDNDADGLIDYPQDPGCTSFSDLSEADPTPTCTDTDGGYNISIQGTASGLLANGSSYSYTDFCIDTINLKEYYCVNVVGGGAILQSQTINCPNNTTTSCINGACV